jgi:uncharacterized protein YijF (DUF1287 family)
MNTKFKAGDKVEWTNSKGLKQVGVIIETGNDTKYLIKYNDGKYIAIREEKLIGVKENGK